MPGLSRRLAAALLALALFGAFALACHLRSGARASGPLFQEVYVWQRLWGPEVGRAVAEAGDLGNLVVLAAEIDLRQDPPRVARAGVDWRLLAAARPRAGLALRILPFPGRFSGRPGGRAARAEIVALVRELAGEARAHGLSPAELQLDYDCADSKLDDYRDLLVAVRRAVSPLPVTITALPSWLDHRAAFAALARAADGYVLQVHSLRAPAQPGDPGLLCDPAAARRAVKTAARFGRPFRVALPTYGYLAGFTPSGRLVGLSAEGPELAWPPGTVVALARSDPAALAGLVRGWTRDRPRELAGLLWYRLPVSGDRRNWSPETFRAVRAGIAPHGEIRALAAATAPGLFDLTLANASTADAPSPATLRVRWRNADLVAADGLAGYRARPVGPGELRLERPESAVGWPLRPGERRPVGWLRFAGRPPAELDVQSGP